MHKGRETGKRLLFRGYKSFIDGKWLIKRSATSFFCLLLLIKLRYTPSSVKALLISTGRGCIFDRDTYSYKIGSSMFI